MCLLCQACGYSPCACGKREYQRLIESLQQDLQEKNKKLEEENKRLHVRIDNILNYNIRLQQLVRAFCDNEDLTPYKDRCPASTIYLQRIQKVIRQLCQEEVKRMERKVECLASLRAWQNNKGNDKDG